MENRYVAALYCRLSEEDRHKGDPGADSESIQNQKMMLTEYANRQNWAIYDCYSDDDWAGTDRSRPAFCRLLADARARKFDIVLCKTQSRFTRELEMVEKYIHGLFPLWGIRFISIVDHVDSAEHANKKNRQINALINEWYLEDMSENIRSVLTMRRRQGLHIGGQAVYGYIKDPAQKGHLLIDPEAAEVVRFIFDSYAEGRGKTAIARRLNEKNIPNPTEYKRRKGQMRRLDEGKSTRWSYGTVSAILKNEMYIGHMVQGRYGSISYKSRKNQPRPREEWIRVEHTHEPIISREVWSLVQDMQNERRERHVQMQTDGQCETGGSVLIRETADAGTCRWYAGKVHCGICGRPLGSVKSHGRYYLRCTTRYVDKGACSGTFIPVADLEWMLREENLQICDSYLDRECLIREIDGEEERIDLICVMERWLKNVEVKLEQVKQGMSNLYIDKVKGEIDIGQYHQYADTLAEEQATLLGMQQGIRKKMTEQKRRRAAARTDAIIERYVQMDAIDRTFMERMVEDIVVYGRNPANKEMKVVIHWKI